MAAVVGAASTRRGRGPRLGVALSATELTAAIQRPGERARPWRMNIAPLNGDSSGWPGLAEALRALARDAQITDGRLTVALMTPLAETRGVDLPPVSDAEVHQLLTRGASRYFIAGRGAQVVGAVRGARGAGATGSTMVAAAPTRVVSAIHEAAVAAGWTVESVIPAEAAWSLAASRWSRARGPAQLLVAHSDRTDLLRVNGGRLVDLRRFRAGLADAELIADAAKLGGGALSIVGSPETRRELSRVLAERGISVETPASAVAEISEQPALLAAAFAEPSASPSLVTDAARAARAETIRRFAMRLGMVAAGVFLIGGALELWGARRELNAIRTERAALKPQLSVTLVGSTSVQMAYNQLAVLATAERTAQTWSSVFTSLSRHVPEDAYLTGFRGRGDSVSVDGLAAHASRVIVALERAPELVGAHAVGQIRRENPTDGPPMERFTVAARIAARGIVAPATPLSPTAGTPR